jgi:hypothetical protein
MSSVPPANSGDNNAQRRSQRVTVKVSVAVLAQGPTTNQSQKNRGQLPSMRTVQGYG